jgi:hypothetical protein
MTMVRVLPDKEYSEIQARIRGHKPQTDPSHPHETSSKIL